jgi:transposase
MAIFGAGMWAAETGSRLRALVQFAHQQGFWIRFCTLDGVSGLQRDRLLTERVEPLMSVLAIGPTTAPTWALEIGEVRRFSSIRKAISYCGLCGDEKRSANAMRWVCRSAAR